MRHGRTIVAAVLVLAAVWPGGGVREALAADGTAVLDGRFGMPIAPIYLLLRADVQADLHLQPRQVAGARELAARLIERGLNARHKSEAAARAERRAIDEAMAGWLRRELSGPQLERLTQINLQWEGASALRRGTVAEYLALGGAQRLKIDQVLAGRDRKRAAGGLAPGEFDRLGREALAILTPPQREQWEGLLGPPCRFVIGSPPSSPREPAAAELKGRRRPADRSTADPAARPGGAAD